MTTHAPLVIEYVLDGPQRGYRFTTPTHMWREDVIKAVWRGALPRGQGWGDFTGAQTLKCFPLPDGSVAVCRTAVTDHEDESGRKGIRRTEIDILSVNAYRVALTRRYEALTPGLKADAEFEIAHWGRLRTLQRLNRMGGTAPRLILTHPFSTPADWRLMEALLLRLAVNPPDALRRWGLFSFTTLALTHHDESRVVTVPAGRLNGDTRDALVVSVG